MRTILVLVGLFCFCMVGLLGLLLYVVITSPSCEERGGTLIQEGHTTQVLLIGKVMIPQTVPLYKCVIP